MSNHTRHHQSGFTIVELMLATLVFSVILMIITTGVLQFTRQYYKGVISSSTQNAARTLVDDITRALQFNAGGFTTLTKVSTSDTTTNTKGYCIGDSKRYSFSRNWQVKGSSPSAAVHQNEHGLISDDFTGCTASTLALDAKVIHNFSAVTPTLENPRELLGDNMRIVKFDISPFPGTADTYNITVRIAYGDDDLLCSPDYASTVAGGCNYIGNQSSHSAAIEAKDNLKCKPQAGRQFCAVSELSTTVKKRVN